MSLRCAIQTFYQSRQIILPKERGPQPSDGAQEWNAPPPRGEGTVDHGLDRVVNGERRPHMAVEAVIVDTGAQIAQRISPFVVDEDVVKFATLAFEPVAEFVIRCEYRHSETDGLQPAYQAQSEIENTPRGIR